MAVGRAVASDTRGLGFESSHWQLLLNMYLLLTVCIKTKIKKKRPGMGHFFKKSSCVTAIDEISMINYSLEPKSLNCEKPQRN